MTWDQVAPGHVGHRCVLRDVRTLECVDCSHKLLLPREPKSTTPQPPPYRAPDLSQVASPETIARAKRRALAEIEHAKKRRTTCCDRHHFEGCTDGAPGCCPSCPINPAPGAA